MPGSGRRFFQYPTITGVSPLAIKRRPVTSQAGHPPADRQVDRAILFYIAYLNPCLGSKMPHGMRPAHDEAPALLDILNQALKERRLQLSQSGSTSSP